MSKMTKYEVIVTRTLTHQASVEVEAESPDAAQTLGYEQICAVDTQWIEGHLVDETTKVRVIRD